MGRHGILHHLAGHAMGVRRRKHVDAACFHRGNRLHAVRTGVHRAFLAQLAEARPECDGLVKAIYEQGLAHRGDHLRGFPAGIARHQRHRVAIENLTGFLPRRRVGRAAPAFPLTVAAEPALVLDERRRYHVGRIDALDLGGPEVDRHLDVLLPHLDTPFRKAPPTHWSF